MTEKKHIDGTPIPGNTGKIVTGVAAILALMVTAISIVSQGRTPDSSLNRHTPQAAATSTEFDEQELLDLLFINSFESNQAPQIVSPARRYASPLHSYEYPVQVFDAEDDPVLFALQAGPVGMQIDLFSGQLVWTAPMLGAHSIEVVVSDIFGGFDTQAWTLTVGDNSPPQILSTPTAEAQAGRSWQYLPEVVDPDLELLDHALDTAPVGMIIDPETGRMDWVPEMAGNFAVEWRVQDPSGAIDTQAFTIAVEAPDDAPPTITSTPPVQASIDAPWVYSIQAADPDDNIDVFRVVEGPVGMQIDPATGRVDWTPAEVESAEVTVEVLDTAGLSDQQGFTVSVSSTPGTTPPEWQGPVTLTAPLGRTSTFQLAAFDADGDALRYFVEPLPLPAGMGFSSLTGALEFTPSLDQVGDLELELAASDGRFRVYRDFTVTVPPPDGPTRLRGRVMHGLDEPLPGVRLVIGVQEAFAGPDGYFEFEDLTISSEVGMLVDGSSADLPGTFATVPKAVELIAGADNLLQDPIILLPLDTDSADSVNPSATSEITSAPVVKDGETFAPVTLTIPPGTARWEETGELYDGEIHITNIPDNRLSPQPLPRELGFAVYVAMQPFGVVYDQPVPISFPNVDGLLPGSRMEIFGLDHQTGEFVKFGDAEVSADGETVDSIGGVVVANSWHGMPPPPPDPDADGEDDDSDDKEEEDCECGSRVGLTEGNLIVRHRLAAYRSLEQDRAVVLRYNHTTADVNPIVNFRQRLPSRIFAPTDLQISARINVGGLTLTREQFWSSDDVLSQAGLQFPARTLASGVYDYEVEADLKTRFASRLARVSGKLSVVNLADSPFGSGWHIEGLERIHVGASGDVLINSGRARGTVFRRDADGLSAPPGEFSTLIETQDGFERRYPGGLVKHFDQDGNQTSEVDRNGNETRYAYDEAGRLLTIIDPVGLETTFDYFAGKLARITDPAGRTTRFGHDAFGNLTGIIEPDGGTRQFEYAGSNGRLIAQTNQREASTDYTYDTFGRLASADRADESRVDSVPSMTQGLVNPEGSAGSPEQPASPVPVADVVARINNGNGNEVRFKLDARGKIVERLDALERVTSIARDRDSNPVKLTRPDGSKVERTFDEKGNLLVETELANNASISATYDEFSFLTSLTDPRGNVFSIERDARGNPVRATNPAGHVTTFGHDARGLLTRIADPNGAEIAREYDDLGRLVRQTETAPAGRVRVTEFEHDAAGNVTAITLPEGSRLAFTYDSEGQVTKVVNDQGERLEFDYDLRGNRTSSRLFNADGSMALRIGSAYDERDRLAELRLPHISTEESVFQFAWDGEGNRTGEVDPNGRITLMEYDQVDRPIRQTDPAGSEVSIGYTLRDQVESVVAPNGANTTFDYDDLARRTGEQSPDRGTIELAYDLADNLVASTDARGIKREIDYDALNRPVQVTYPAPGEDVELTWDVCTNGLGRLCRVVDESGVQVFEYDGFGNIVRVTRTELGVDYVTEYEYDLEDRITAIVYPSGRRVEYDRDILGRVSEVRAEVAGQMQTILSNITYRADGQVLTAEHGNGLVELREYDQQGRLLSTDLIDTAGFVIDERTWTYDPAGNVIERTRNSTAEAFAYDALDRLTSQEIGGGNDASWSYDYGPNHNRRSRSNADQRNELYSYQPDTNRLNTIDRFIAQPEPDSPASVQFGYNQAGRLSEYSENGVLEASYTYNTFGLRTRKETSSGTTVFHYDTGITLLGETDEAGNSQREYVWLNGSPIATIDAVENVAYIHTDHLFTPRLATGPAGAIVWAWEGETFGDVEPTGSLTLNLRFPGQYFDAESGLHYNVMRDYDPALGRYVQSDPIGLISGTNLYAYVSSNPLMLFDIFGLQAQACFRPLRAFPLGVIGNSIDQESNTVIGHEHIFFEDGSNIGFGPDGIVEDTEDRENFSRCEDLGAGKDDILDAVNNVRNEFGPEDYRLRPERFGGRNCQDFVDAVRELLDP